MKKTYDSLIKLSTLVVVFMLLAATGSTQTRQGSIDLHTTKGSGFMINDDDTSEKLQILDGSSTIEMWVKNTVDDQQFNFFNLKSQSSNENHKNKFSLVYHNDSKFEIEIKRRRNGSWKDDQEVVLDNLSKTSDFYNQWRHVAITHTYGSNSIKLYIDGEHVQTVSHSDIGSYWMKSYSDQDAPNWIGYESAADQHKGNFYVGEVRLWNTALGASTIEAYYDKEVNATHPNFSKLQYYYHGTDEYASDGEYKFNDCANTYDGTQTHTTVRVSTGNTPPVRPPDFSSDLGVSFYSTNCNQGNVQLNWTSFRTDADYLDCGATTNRSVGYAVFRDEYSAGTPVYTGTTNSYKDTDVTGGQVYTYRLYTYWEIDDIKVYSDDYIETTGYAATEYAAPSAISATSDNCDGTITIDWASSDSPQYWRLERSVNESNFNAVSSAISGSKYEYTESTSSINSATTYYYRVKAYGVDDNGCTVVSSYSSNAEGYSSDKPSGPTSVTVTPDTEAGTITIDWTEPSYNIADSWIIERKQDGETEWTEIYDGTANTFTQSGSDIEACVVYQYRVGAKNSCTNGIYYDTKTASISYAELDNKLTDFTASKGYFGDGVQLEWEIEGTSSIIETFLLERSVAGNDAFFTIATFDKDLVYRDYTALGNTLYEYRIQATADCDGTTVYTNDLTDAGFKVSFGVANGHVEYSGGNAVEDVKLWAEPKDGMHGSSLYFDGSQDYVKTNDTIDIKNKSFTIEFWSKREETGKGDMIIANGDESSGKYLEIGYQVNDYFKFGFNGMSITHGPVTSTDWIHWACVLDVDNNIYKLYMNGEEVSYANVSDRYHNGTGELYLGSSGSADIDLKGYLDEIRVWNTARSADEINESYSRVLNGNEEGMLAYWRCDEGFGSSIYDASYSGEIFNKHDAVFYGNVVFTEVIPDTDELGIYATTDANGDYSLEYIPYVGSGEIFTLTPSKGQHQFSPGTRSIYIGDGAQTNNNVDFTDISSFSVSGKVTYENSTYPVEGVSVLVDGIQAVSSDNSPVRTDENGKFTIDVPIGYHSISVEKDGHTFSEGHFPPLTEYGDVDTYEFTEDITNLEFIDNTTVKVLGRVVGGTTEGDKQIGFHLSTNNIGVAEIQFKIQQDGYDLDETDDAIYAVISIETDAYSGEYEVNLIPEKWEIQKAGNDTYYLDPNDLAVVNLENSLMVTQVIDSTFIEDLDGDYYEVDTNWYHHRLDYIVREDMQIEVTNDEGNAFDGESSYTYTDQETGEEITIDLTVSDPFNYPIFQSYRNYTANIFVYEAYSNPDHPDGAIVDKVPVNKAAITIVNNLMVNAESEEGQTASDGTYSHTFQAGAPNISLDDENSFTKTLEIYASNGAETYMWGDEAFRGYLLGALPIEGTDFITYGPEVVSMVLRDPPGSNSYAYIEKGSKYSTSKKWQMNYNTNTGLDNTTHTGISTGIGGGLAGPLIFNETIIDSELGLTLIRKGDYSGTYTETIEFNERIETSSDTEDVGSDADLYIGESYNAYISQSKNLKILSKAFCDANGIEHYPSDGSQDTVLGILDGVVIDQDKSSTFFIYSQRHIISELIPDLINARDVLLATNDKYQSNIEYGHQFYGLNNDDNSVAQAKIDSIAKYSVYDTTNFCYTFLGDIESETDSVAFFNNQITLWINAIAMNEAEKANAKLVDNISIDGSAGAYTSEISESHNSAYNWMSSRQIKFDWNAQYHSILGGNGYTGKSTFQLNFDIGRGETEEAQHDVTFGYVIDERDEGDYYSIDVKREEGVGIYAADKFSDFVTNKNDFINQQLMYAGIGTGAMILKSSAAKIAEKFSSKSLYWIAAAGFVAETGAFIYEMADVTQNALATYDEIDGNSEWEISGFNISSPIFSVKGGQTRCPYEGDEYSSFYVDDNEEIIQFNIATLQREIPVIEVEQSFITGVPEGETADFTLYLQNESASGTDVWYELSILHETNPNGAVLLIDGIDPEKQFLVPAWETLTKTLTVAKGVDEVFEYDSIGIVLHSACQYNPADEQDDIGDTLYISVHFEPECTDIDLKNMQDNWVLNYDDNKEMNVTLTDYNINHSTLEMLEFQYKTLTGNSVGAMAWFAEEGDAYNAYTGDKDLIDGNSEVGFVWDVSSLNDREYLIRARSTCSDGSTTEGDWYTGLFDTKPPKVFGTPTPGDGILTTGEDISIRFDETLESGIINDNNFSIVGVLNGTEISHNASMYFDGATNYGSVSDGINLTYKSFTLEFWLRRNAQTENVVLSQGEDETENLKIGFDAGNNFYLQMAGQTFRADPSAAYTSEYPWNTWHHYAVTYDISNNKLRFYIDDVEILSENNVEIDYQTTGKFYLGKSASATGTAFEGNMHEFRIWDDVRSFGELYSNMSLSLSGREANLYRLWEMNEGTGEVIADKVRNQVMRMEAQWAIEPAGKAVAFNGTNQYLELNGTHTLIDEETDMAIEFWFKGETPATKATLLSNGKGNGIEEYATSTENLMSITAQTDGSITVNTNGYAFNAVSNNYFDNNWHHFALVVDRDANAKAYIDTELQNSIEADSIAQFANSKIFIGARGYATDAATYSFDQYFNGTLDEIRFWNSVRNSDQLEMYANAKLNGDEDGLLGYYPFEYYEEVMGINILTETFNDQWMNPYGNNNGSAIPMNGTSITDEAPEIKDARPVQDVAFDFVVNDDEIILTPTESATKLENTVLEITVKDVYDLNGNRLLSPAVWTAYIDQNQIIWDVEEIELEKEIYASQSFTVKVQNIGGTSEEFEIDNIPDWLEASVESDVMEPNSEMEITFTVNEATNPGQYEDNIELLSDYGFVEKLNVKLHVYQPEPDWSVDESDYNYSMNLVGKLKINDIYTTDTYDKIGVFSDNVCCGVAHVKYVNSRDDYLVFLTIYSNNITTGLEYKVWDSSEGQIFSDVNPEYSFTADMTYGTINAPIEISAGRVIDTDIPLSQGWNWISLNMTPGSSDVNDVLSSIDAETGDQIKNTGFANYDGSLGMWLGSLTHVNAGLLYKLYVSKENTMHYSGEYINPESFPVQIVNGWNWIGFLPQTNIEVNQALAAYPATTDDIIKSQGQFAMFDGTEWIGTLFYLEPNEGYMLNSQTTDTIEFTYPERGTLSNKNTTINRTSDFEGIALNSHQYASSFSMVASVAGLTVTKDAKIGVYSNQKLIGTGSLVNSKSSDLFFITIMGDANMNGMSLQFRFLNNDGLFNLESDIEYIDNGILGTVQHPHVFSTATQINEASNVSESVQVSPNPFSNQLNIDFSNVSGKILDVKLMNVTGEVIRNLNDKATTDRIQIEDTEVLKQGVYFLVVTTANSSYNLKMVKH